MASNSPAPIRCACGNADPDYMTWSEMVMHKRGIEFRDGKVYVVGPEEVDCGDGCGDEIISCDVCGAEIAGAVDEIGDYE